MTIPNIFDPGTYHCITPCWLRLTSNWESHLFHGHWRHWKRLVWHEQQRTAQCPIQLISFYKLHWFELFEMRFKHQLKNRLSLKCFRTYLEKSMANISSAFSLLEMFRCRKPPNESIGMCMGSNGESPSPKQLALVAPFYDILCIWRNCGTYQYCSYWHSFT